MKSAGMVRCALGMMPAAVLAVLAGCGGHSFDKLSVGDRAPPIRTKTLADVGGDLSRITTYRQPDERMYKYSLDQALATGRPIFLEFATPGHCTPCDRQLQMTKSLLEKYQAQMIFLHMDQYDNPEAYKAYHVLGDPWTFVIDRRGVVRFRQPGAMLYNEMEDAIRASL